ncbi:unnamed protein product [Caenorhabditis sp. 36 PRJEB53466]|nr:unnamed protein product [Caenorhabditis sp. 36 PRJEB53466]
MGPKAKKAKLEIGGVDLEYVKNHNLSYICGYCQELVGGSDEQRAEHVNKHATEITACRNCCAFVKLTETKQHTQQFHNDYPGRVKYELDDALIEFRIQTGKSFSTFWGNREKNDKIVCNFPRFVKTLYSKHKNGRSLGVFRIRKSQFYWNCPICSDFPVLKFGDTVGMRCSVLRHLEHFHRQEIDQNAPGFFESEWDLLEEETNFDVRSLIESTEKCLKVKERSMHTFYTINLSRIVNGSSLLSALRKRSGILEDSVRFCLVCNSLVPTSGIYNHFRLKMHLELNAKAENTIFSHKIEAKKEKENDVKEEIVEEKMGPKNFQFPEQVFEYSTVFKTLRKDEFKWRCLLCRKRHAHNTFATSIIMRMYALRHLDEHHRFLFTDEFLEFEWSSLRNEMRAQFDIRHFTPLQYTLKGEETFNKNDPNDYVLPQQPYFLPKECAPNTVICGFCYRSLRHDEFLQHIVIHGFGRGGRKVPELKAASIDSTVSSLMGQEEFVAEELDDEPLNILSIDGKRLKQKMEVVSERFYSSQPAYSDVTTPGGPDTPRRNRKSAVDARKLLADTFRILQENAKNQKLGHSSASSCSSSSDDDDSEEERFEKKIQLEMFTTKERKERKNVQNRNESGKRNLKKMKPAEINQWIREEAGRMGVEWTGDRSSSSPESSEDDDDVADSKNLDGEENKWSRMNLQDIKTLIRAAAAEKSIKFTEDDSSDTDSDD